MKIDFTLNGKAVSIEAPAGISLLTLLREHLGLTGAKPGCESGECGACSIMVDGRLVNACMLLAPQAGGCAVLTIEGVFAPGGGLTALQQAFIERGAVQCGYCTPGLIMAAIALLEANPAPTREEIREGIAGNLCRCTGYQQIVDAIEAAARQQRATAKKEALVGVNK